jgi:uncharacterized protein (TIGR02001 family)
MNRLVLSVVATCGLVAPALAADVLAPKAPPVVLPPATPVFDIAFGGAGVTDYVFRGVTQSNHQPSVNAYVEPRWNVTPDIQLYVGMAGNSVNLSNTPSAEIDFYGGIRPTFGPVVFDFGFWYYWYPGGTCYGAVGCTIGTPPQFIKGDTNFWEVYAKATWTPIEPLALGVNFYYTPSFLNSGADGEYLSGTIKYTGSGLPNGIGWYISAEVGYQWLGTTDSFYGIAAGTPILGGGVTSGIFAAGVPLTDYLTWNVGLGFTWKAFTLDLRYSDTNLSKSECYVFTGDYNASRELSAASASNPGGFSSKWCGSVFIAKLAVDLTLVALK